MSKEMAENNTPEAIEVKAKRWLRSLGALLELDETGRVCKVNLRGTQITDAGLRYLMKRLTNLENLNLSGTQVTVRAEMMMWQLSSNRLRRNCETPAS